jgi:hypothetical protein
MSYGDQSLALGGTSLIVALLKLNDLARIYPELSRQPL